MILKKLVSKRAKVPMFRQKAAYFIFGAAAVSILLFNDLGLKINGRHNVDC